MMQFMHDPLQVECWICYDSDSKVGGSLIQPCGCKGDVGYVHHDCLRRWLVEAAQAGSGERELSCGVCRQVTINLHSGLNLNPSTN